MDALYFRSAALMLQERLLGLRLGKVFGPAPNLWTFDCGRPGWLVLHTGRRPFLFLSAHKPENPANPGGLVLWLRRRIVDRRILSVALDWSHRQLAFELSSGEGRWLLLSLQTAPALLEDLPESFGAFVEWPSLTEARSNTGIWKTYPQVSPPLRRELVRRSPEAAEVLWRAAQSGSSNTGFCCFDAQGTRQVRLWEEGDGCVKAEDVLDAAEWAYGGVVSQLVRKARDGQDRSAARRRKIERSLQNIERDRERLTTLLAQGEKARLLRAVLYAVDKEAHLDHITVYDTDGPRELELAPEKSVRENMEYWFARAAKAKRGLPVVKEREAALRAQLENVVQITGEKDRPADAPKIQELPARYRKFKITQFRSSDGFLILRGRSAEANHQLLTKVASPFDFWLHAQNGPGAHVIVRRDSPRQQVPESTLLQAACLAALSSHLQNAGTGDVLLCLARDIRAIKGAQLGMVTVEKVLQVLRPEIVREMEEDLRLF